MLDQILAQFPKEMQCRVVEALGNAGGFSGALIWKLDSNCGQWCLRRWPIEHPSLERLEFIHSVQRLARENGQTFAPQLAETIQGSSFYQDDQGCLWELAEWMPGSPALAPTGRGLDNQCDESMHDLLRHAMRCLAEFHLAVEKHPHSADGLAASPGLASRLKFCQTLLHGELDLARDALQSSTVIYRNELNSIFQLASPRIRELHNRLSSVAGDRVAIQPCLRDVWHDHILFYDGKVSGFIDFGAVALDTVATDVARLLTSVETHIAGAWAIGVPAYAAIRSLSVAEQRCLPVFREATVVLSGFNWIRWLAIENRRFEDHSAVRKRLQAIVGSLHA